MRKRLLCILVLFCTTSALFAQKDSILYTPLNYNFKNIPVDSALNYIENDIGFYFIYDAELLAEKPQIKARFTNYPLSVILDSLFNNPILEYEVIQKQIVIFKNRIIENNSLNDSIAPKFKIVRGIVIDSSNKNSLPYSTISILNKGVGSISNQDGKFNFKIKEEYFLDTLIISHLGFTPIQIKISELTEYHNFKLIEKAISLQEILIRWTDPKELLINSLHAVKNNYPNNPSQLRTFYRESLKRNNKYMSYIEGLLDIYKSSYRPTLFSDHAKLLQLRKFSNFDSNDSILIKLQGGINSSLSLDLIKHPLDFINLNSLELYNYYYSGIESIDNVDAHTIRFEPSDENLDKIYEGTIHIDLKTLAIIRIQFNIVKSNYRNSRNNIVLKSNPGIRVIPKSIEYIISYKKINDKYYFNHVAGDMNLKVKRKRKMLSSNYKIHFEMISTDMTLSNIKRFKRDERVRTRQILTDIESIYIENLNQYWGINNYILPEENLLKALNKFNVEELKYYPN